jgi:mono/diheme cytochrome c family protein
MRPVPDSPKLRAAGRLPTAAALLLFALAAAGAAQEPELPEGEGKRILVAACTSCHGLDYVAKLNGYYTRAQWRDVVNTMVEYGTKLEQKEEEVLVDYLTQHFGKK